MLSVSDVRLNKKRCSIERFPFRLISFNLMIDSNSNELHCMQFDQSNSDIDM